MSNEISSNSAYERYRELCVSRLAPYGFGKDKIRVSTVKPTSGKSTTTLAEWRSWTRSGPALTWCQMGRCVGGTSYRAFRRG